MTIQSYRDLRAWQMAIDLVEEVYKLTRTFPKSETYGLSSQMQRAAVSVPANLAEGHQRDSTKEYLRHLSIALGSIAELTTLVTICERLAYVNRPVTDRLREKVDDIGRMLRGLQKSLKAKL